MTARILDCTVDEYHADPCPTPSLSASLATVMATKSPAHAWLEHPKLGKVEEPEEGTKATDAGELIHTLMLGNGRPISIIEAPDFKTKKAREDRDVARATGKLPVLAHKLADGVKVAKILTDRLEALKITLDGESEVKIGWQCETDDGELLLCRSMIDHAFLTEGRIFDLKTIRSASPKQCSRSAIDYGYDIQWAAYTKAVGALHPHLIGAVDMIFLFCEIEPPYAVTPARPDGMMRELGLARWNRAASTWAKCLRSGEWPGYATDVVPLTVPGWALMDEGLTAAGLF